MTSRFNNRFNFRFKSGGVRAATVLAVAAVVGSAFTSAPANAARLVGLTNMNELLTFDSAVPGSTNAVAISNLAAGESIISIDYRNTDQQIYGLGSLGTLYALNASTGVATAFGAGVVPAVGAGVSYEIDWNPANNNLRVIGNGAAPNSNRAFNFASGVTAVQTALTRADGGGALNIVGAAYNHNFPGSVAADLSLYYLDAASDALFVNRNAFAGGVLTKVADLTLGGVAFGISQAAGFDIGADGQAFAAWGENLYGIDLGSGALSLRGSIGANHTVIGLTAMAVPEPESYALLLGGLGVIGFVVRRRSRNAAQ